MMERSVPISLRQRPQVSFPSLFESAFSRISSVIKATPLFTLASTSSCEIMTVKSAFTNGVEDSLGLTSLTSLTDCCCC